MADTGETTRQDVQQEAPQKLIGAEGHFPFLVAVGVILPPECHLIVTEGKQPMIRDSNAVRVARKIVQHVLWSAKRTFGVDNPVLPEQLPEELRKRRRLCKQLE